LREKEALMTAENTTHSTATSATPAAPATASGRSELARYRVSSGARVLYCERINRGAQITDRPASGRGRTYVVEAALTLDGDSTLDALVCDYIEQARKLDEIPMASSVIRHALEQLGTSI
jgi:hypothetical protein